jgi:Flp pilus assembly protein TadG
MSEGQPHRQRGQAFVELALLLPIVLLLLGGAVDLGRAYFLGIETSNGAAQAALYVADNSSNTGSPPTSFSSTELKTIVAASYGGSVLACPDVSVVQNQSGTATGPSSVNSDTYPTSGPFYEYVTVTCRFAPLTPLFPIDFSLRATSSDYVVEAN